MLLGLVIGVSVLVIGLTFVANNNKINKVKLEKAKLSKENEIQSMAKLPVVERKRNFTSHVAVAKDKTKTIEKSVGR